MCSCTAYVPAEATASAYEPRFARLIRLKRWDELFATPMDEPLVRNLLEAIQSEIIPEQYLFRLLYNRENWKFFDNNIVLLKRYFVKPIETCSFHTILAVVYLFYMSDENEVFFRYHYPEWIFYDITNLTTPLFQHFFTRVVNKLQFIKSFSHPARIPCLLVECASEAEMRSEIATGAWVCCHSCRRLDDSKRGCQHFPLPSKLNHSRLCECKKHYF